MSGIHGLGGHGHHVAPVSTSTAAAPTGATSQSNAGASDPLKALQGLLKQLESSANTRAIPAHQNW
jgi:hypothetical protein